MIPEFPSRLFQYSSIYVNCKSGIREAKDLNPECQMTALLWIRGILQDNYSAPVEKKDFYDHAHRGNWRGRV